MSKESIYTLKLVRKGLDIFKGRSLDVLKKHTVEKYICRDIETVDPDTPAIELMDLMLGSEKPQFYVVDKNGRLTGVIAVNDLGRILTHHQGLEQVLLAEDLTTEDVAVCTPAENLSEALLKFERAGLTELPVVNESVNRTLFGRASLYGRCGTL